MLVQGKDYIKLWRMLHTAGVQEKEKIPREIYRKLHSRDPGGLGTESQSLLPKNLASLPKSQVIGCLESRFYVSKFRNR